MQIGLIGLGRMGLNMARRWLRGGHEVVAFNRSYDKTEKLAAEDGATPVKTIEELVSKLEGPKLIWLMLPIGGIIDEHLDKLIPMLSKGDIIVEGGNSYYKDDLKRSARLKEAGIHYLDAGVSGGIWGLKIGYCTMVGGEEAQFKHIEPLLETLAPPEGYLHCGPSGAGHFVKMIHNGIEYALMEAYGEGFELLKASPYADNFNFEKIAHLWNQGSVVRSWLLELVENAFAEDKELDQIQGYVEDSGEGRWTVLQAVESGVSATAIAHALFKRFQSRQTDVFSDKVQAAMRNQFGGHAVAKKGENKRQGIAGAGSVQAASADENKTG